MARGDDPDRPRRRWGREREEGPSEEDLGWLADLRGARGERPPGPQDPTSTMVRGRRSTPPPPPPPTPRGGGARRSAPPAPPPSPEPPLRGGPSWSAAPTGRLPAGEAWYDQSGDTRRTRPPGPGIPPVSPLEPPPPGAAKIKRAEMRRQLRIAQQLKAGTLAIVAVLLLAAYPLYLFIRATAQDPVYGELDALNLPDWAAGMHDDNYQGNRWCIGQCRVRDRTWESQRAPVDTQRAYESALREGGWQIRSTGPCPAAHVGVASCWKRDEYVLDMWIRAPICNIPPPRPTISSSRTSTASPKPTSPATTGPAASCPGSLVTVKVFNAAGYYPLDWTESGVGGSPSPSPGGVPSATR